MSIFENYKNIGKIKEDNLDYEHALNSPGNDNINLTQKEKINLFVYFIPVILVFCIFIFQIFKLQIVQGAEHQFLAEGNRLRIEDYKAPRGIVYDTKNQALVKNIPLYNLEIFPIDLPSDKTERVKIYEKLSDYNNEEFKKVITEIEEKHIYQAEPIILKSYLERDEAMKLQMSFTDVPGVRISVMPAREYEEIPGLAHVMGYIGKITQEQYEGKENIYAFNDFLGQNGLELAYEEYLKGENGKTKVEVDSTGKIQRKLETKDPVAGYDIYTYLDRDLQKKTAEVIEEKLKDTRENTDDKKRKDTKKAALIAIDPRTGGIISMLSFPYYNNNLFSKGIKQEEYEKLLENEDNPLLNRCVSGIYPSGSVIKPVIAVAGLDKGVISENTTIQDPGEIKIGEWVFPDWKNHGTVDTRKAIAVSCNVFFYAVGGGWENISGLGPYVMKDYLERFGFGKETGIELLGEEKGTIPDPEWKQEYKNETWYLGDTYHMAIGQGDFLVTPLQMVNSIATIANGGTLYKPHFAKNIKDHKGNIIKEITPEILNEHFLEDGYSIEVVRQGMKQAVDASYGTARQLQDLPVTSAGKTGTAQFDGSDLSKTHSWFVGFAPYDNPEIAIVVIVEGGGDGFDVAEPIAHDVLKYYFENK